MKRRKTVVDVRHTAKHAMRASVTGHERRRQANLSRGKSKTRLGRRCYIVPPDSVRRSEGVALVELAACENE